MVRASGFRLNKTIYKLSEFNTRLFGVLNYVPMKWCTKLHLPLSAKPIRYVLLFGHTYKSLAGSASSPQISTMIP